MRAFRVLKMIPPRLRLPLSSLAAFALGVGLAATWFLGREPADPEKARALETGTTPRLVAATSSEAAGRPKPWKMKFGADQPPSSTQAAVDEDLEESETIRRGLRAQFRHQARSEALELTYLLGLDPTQADGFLTALLRDADTRLNGLSPPWLTNSGTAWLESNLSPEQKAAHRRYRESKRRAETERQALEETNEIARAMELTEEQRAALIQKFADTHISIDEFTEFIHYGEPIDTKATAADGTPTTVVITESRIEMPVFSHPHRQPWLAEILTEDQLATYREFQAQQRELERLMQEEMRATEDE